MKDQKPKPAKCYNCKFGGNQFKIAGTTHLHCHNNEKYPIEKMESGKISPWDTLRELHWGCEFHQPKNQEQHERRID